MRGKITSRRAKRLDGRERKKERKREGKKNESPPRQKASVVSKWTLICNLADPRLEEACGKDEEEGGKKKKKKKETSQVVLFAFCHPRPGVVLYANLVVEALKVFGFHLCPQWHPPCSTPHWWQWIRAKAAPWDLSAARSASPSCVCPLNYLFCSTKQNEIKALKLPSNPLCARWWKGGHGSKGAKVKLKIGFIQWQNVKLYGLVWFSQGQQKQREAERKLHISTRSCNSSPSALLWLVKRFTDAAEQDNSVYHVSFWPWEHYIVHTFLVPQRLLLRSFLYHDVRWVLLGTFRCQTIGLQIR